MCAHITIWCAVHLFTLPVQLDLAEPEWSCADTKHSHTHQKWNILRVYCGYVISGLVSEYVCMHSASLLIRKYGDFKLHMAVTNCTTAATCMVWVDLIHTDTFGSTCTLCTHRFYSLQICKVSYMVFASDFFFSLASVQFPFI